MSEDVEEILIDEDIAEEETGESEEHFTTEELKVKGEDLLETVKKIVREAGIRRVVIKNNQDRVLIEIPLVFGLAGIALLPTWAAVALIATLVTDCSIIVERVEKAAEKDAAAEEEAAEELETTEEE